MSGFRLEVRDFEQTLPVVHPQRGDAHPETFSGIPDRWDDTAAVNRRADEQLDDGTGSVLLLVVEALCWVVALALIASLFKAPQIWEQL